MSSSVHTNQQRQRDPLANANLEPATVAQPRRNLEALPCVELMEVWKQREASGIPPEVLRCVSFYEIMTSNGQQRMARPFSTIQHRPLSFGLYLCPSQTSSSVRSSKTSHALFPGCFQKKTLNVCSHQNIIPRACLNQQKHLLTRRLPEK